MNRIKKISTWTCESEEDVTTFRKDNCLTKEETVIRVADSSTAPLTLTVCPAPEVKTIFIMTLHSSSVETTLLLNLWFDFCSCLLLLGQVILGCVNCVDLFKECALAFDKFLYQVSAFLFHWFLLFIISFCLLIWLHFAFLSDFEM